MICKLIKSFLAIILVVIVSASFVFAQNMSSSGSRKHAKYAYGL